MRRLLTGLVGALLVLTMTPVAASAAPREASTAPREASTPVTAPDTPVGRQVTWLVDISHRLPISDPEAAAHLSPAVLAVISVADFNAGVAALSGTTGWTLLRYKELSSQAARFLVGSDAGTMLGGVGIDGASLIASLGFLPELPEPTSWAELDQRLAGIAPRVSLLAARVDDQRCLPVHSLAARTARPLGSAFKLYVLGALATQVRAGRAEWDEVLPLREDWKSLPSGQLQDLPAGTPLTLRTYADLMIAISDNTAADHLINRVGATEVQRQQERFGIADPRRNVPFLTTRELFTLKLTDYPRLLDRYARQPLPARTRFVRTVIDPLPLPTLDSAISWTAPRGIDSAEWFASPTDICRAFAGLSRQAAQPGGQPVADALSINDGGLWLDSTQWTATWFKGGSEPGVLTLNYLARTTTGTYVVSVMVSDPTTIIDEQPAVAELLSLIRGAFALAATPPHPSHLLPTPPTALRPWSVANGHTSVGDPWTPPAPITAGT